MKEETEREKLEKSEALFKSTFNLACDLAFILRALRRKGYLHLDWPDESAAKWHNLPQPWKDYILHE